MWSNSYITAYSHFKKFVFLMQCNYKMVKLPEQAEDSTGRQIIFGHEPSASKK